MKVSIIMPVYNAEKYLRDALDSIVNQTIGVDNLEVIIVNDASTDSSKRIIDEYSKKHPTFKPIHLKENTGGPFGPRNIALKHVSCEYVMFLDADDTYTPTACEALYEAIKNTNAGVAFGRYNRVYDDITLISYSPYDPGDNDIKTYPNFGTVTTLIWKVLYRILYGKPLKYRDSIIITDIRKNPEILKILPSMWTKIVRRDKIVEFKPFVAGEDLNFILDVFYDSEIIFLNNEVIVNYSMRFDGDLSVTKNVKFQLVLDTIQSYKLAIEKSNQEGLEDVAMMMNPFFVNYINLLRQGDFTDDEKKQLYHEISEIDRIYKNRKVMGHLLVRMIKFLSR
ncbi:glycosyltransferase family 2 protein [Methanobrevibacter sp.]